MHKSMKDKPTNITHSVTVNNLEIQVSADELYNFDAVEIDKNKWHVLFDKKSMEAELIESNFRQRTYKVKVNNKPYKIRINNSLDSIIKELGFEIGTNKKVNDIKAPMPGLILDINVKVGQEVKENDPLLILEAMKMENVIVSPREGIIRSIHVEKGNAVDKNQLLVEFE